MMDQRIVGTAIIFRQSQLRFFELDVSWASQVEGPTMIGNMRTPKAILTFFGTGGATIMIHSDPNFSDLRDYMVGGDWNMTGL